jgi:transcriptional regulator with XRE-family HTH domain
MAHMGAKPIAAAFGKVLRDCRIQVGVSQEDVALTAEIDRTFVSLLERGLRQPTLDTIFRLARALEIAPATLVSRTAALIER